MVAPISRRKFVVGVSVTVVGVTLPAVGLAGETDPVAFARSLYALENYWADITATDESARHYLDDNLAGLVAENYAKDDVESALDYDPLVQAQDWDEVTTRFTVDSQNATSAVVTVGIENFGERANVTLDLTMASDGWRLSDILGADGASLVKELQRLNGAG
jgi:hypothetical protein